MPCKEKINRADTFAFIDHLESIAGDLVAGATDEAVASVLRRMRPGHYNTDLGSSLSEFQQKYLDKINSRTTLIFLGDGRNNYNDPRLDLFDGLLYRPHGADGLVESRAAAVLDG